MNDSRMGFIERMIHIGTLVLSGMGILLLRPCFTQTVDKVLLCINGECMPRQT